MVSSIYLSACHKQSPEKQSFFENFRQKSILILDPSIHPCTSSESVHIGAEDTLISYFDRLENQIRMIGYLNKKTDDTLCFDDFFSSYEIDHFLDFCYVNKDSIFVCANYLVNGGSRLNYNIFLFNMNGQISKQWDIAKMTGIDDDFFCISSINYEHYRMIYRNGIIYALTTIRYPPFEAYDFTKVPTVLVLNTITDKADFIYGLSGIYGKGDFYGSHADEHSMAFINDTTFVLSFPIDHHLYLFHTNGNLLLKKECKSIYIDKIKAFNKDESVTFDKLIDAESCYPYYHSIHFDTKNKLIYRIAFHEQNVLNEDGERNSIYDRSFSIMVLDEHLNLLGDYFIPPYHFVPYIRFMDIKENLYLQLAGKNDFFVYVEYEYLGNNQTAN